MLDELAHFSIRQSNPREQKALPHQIRQLRQVRNGDTGPAMPAAAN